jgi:glyoxylase-like metal-dependent hydrolase (beta-lactamase superfamily II)
MSNAVTKNMAFPLYEGTFSVGLDKKFNRIDRNADPVKGALKISLNPFLIKSSERMYLFDAGIGEFAEESSTQTIRDNLAEYDTNTDEITDIFASHLHYDHIGGMAGRSSGHWELTFPNAKFWVSQKGWQKIASKKTYYDEEKTEFIRFLESEADLHFLNEEDRPYPEIQTKKTGGHTEFSQVLLFDDGNQKYLMAGDVLATRGEVNRKFAAKYDFDAQTSLEKRQELTRKAWKENYTIMAYHDSHHPLFHLTDYDEKRGYTIENGQVNGAA